MAENGNAMAMDQYPSSISEGDRAILAAIEGWRHEDREAQNAKHDEDRARMDAIDREMKAMAASFRLAFPDGNADDHRRFHEALIRKAEARARLYEKLLAELVSKGLWALVILLVTGLGLVLKDKLMKGGG